MYFYDTLRKTVISEKKIINTLQIVNYGHKTFFLLKDTFMIFFKMQNSGKKKIHIYFPTRISPFDYHSTNGLRQPF